MIVCGIRQNNILKLKYYLHIHFKDHGMKINNISKLEPSLIIVIIIDEMKIDVIYYKFILNAILCPCK